MRSAAAGGAATCDRRPQTECHREQPFFVCQSDADRLPLRMSWSGWRGRWTDRCSRPNTGLRDVKQPGREGRPLPTTRRLRSIIRPRSRGRPRLLRALAGARPLALARAVGRGSSCARLDASELLAPAPQLWSWGPDVATGTGCTRKASDRARTLVVLRRPSGLPVPAIVPKGSTASCPTLRGADCQRLRLRARD